MLWLTAGVEDIEFEPAVIDGISGRPDDRRDAGFRQVQLADRIGQTCRIESDLPSLGLLRKIEAKLMSAGRPHEEFLRFADGVRRILRGVVLWSEGHPDASERLRRRVEWSARRSLTRLLNKPWRDSDAARIAKELRHRKGQLFTFVTEAGVPWHNNEAETQIRQGVLFRKISGGRRSWMGAWVLERLLTVYRTCRKRGIEFLDVVGSALQGNGFPGFGVTSGTPET